MEPVTRKHTPKAQDPHAQFNAMTDTQKRKVFGEDGAKAIENGADMANVVNARQSMDQVVMHGQRVQVTRAGTGPRKKKAPPRLMPEEIYRIAGDDREHAIRLLKKNGYLA